MALIQSDSNSSSSCLTSTQSVAAISSGVNILSMKSFILSLGLLSDSNSNFTSWYSFFNGNTFSEPIEALEDCVAYRIYKSDLDCLYAEYRSFETCGRKLMEESVSFIDYFYKGYGFTSAKDKYDSLLAVYPDITQRAKLGHVASYLGISQETLSRIRGKK